MSFMKMLRNLLRKGVMEQELDEELRFHLEKQIEQNVRSGMSPEEARRQAVLELGGVEQVKEQVREARAGFFIETLWQDVRFGVRMLRKNPGFTVVALLTLALGIGANTAIFSVVHATLLEPLPYPEPDRLVMIWNQYGSNRTSNSPPDYFDRVEQSKLFESFAAFTFVSFNLTGQGEPERLEGASVTASFFTTLGVAPLHGRVFLAEEDSPGRGDVVVLSHGTWLRRFGDDPGVLGSKVQLNDRSFAIIGVMPPRFSRLFPNVEVWAPIAFPATAKGNDNRGSEYLSVLGRMKRGVSLSQAHEEMAAIAARAVDTVPSRRDFLVNAKWSAGIVPLHEQYAGDVRPMVLLLFGAVLLVLLIACANVANLLLARETGRVRELAVRAALGAGRGRIVRQLLVENLLLSVVGGLLGVLLAAWGIGLFSGFGAGSSPLLGHAQLNAQVLAFALGLMFLTGLLFGLTPALRLSRPNLQDGLKEGSRTATPGMRQGSQKALVVSEVALALVLLVAAGLLMRSFQRLWEVHPGFEAANRLTFRVSLPAARYSEPNRRRAFHMETLAALRSLPGVLNAGMIHSPFPLPGLNETATIHVEGREPPPGSPAYSCEYRIISPGYLRTMGIPLLRGRDFAETDGADSPRVVLVDERAAQRYWPGEDPIGKRLGFSPGNWREVIGVVGSVRNSGLDVPGQEQVYMPHMQNPLYGAFYVVHTQGPPEDLVGAVRAQLHNVDASLPLFDVQTMDQRLEGSLSQRRLSMLLLIVFAAVALALAAIGIYGVIAYSVRQRTREIGIRMALGAQRPDILRLIVGQGMRPVLIGLAIGVGAALALTRWMRSLLFGIQPTDPATFVFVAAVLAAVAMLACWLPARRATRVDPMVALRYE